MALVELIDFDIVKERYGRVTWPSLHLHMPLDKVVRRPSADRAKEKMPVLLMLTPIRPAKENFR